MSDPNLDGPLEPPDEVDEDAEQERADAYADYLETRRSDGE